MSLSVNVPSGEKALLVVTFSTSSGCDQFHPNVLAYCLVRVRLDNAFTMPPGEVFFDVNADVVIPALHQGSMQWVVGPLSAGSHTVRVDYRVSNENGRFYVGARTLTVLRSQVAST
jgi:hypothetical protein